MGDITVNRVDRAKQFLPFDALKGLKEELRKREEKLALEEKRIISEEKSLIINETLTLLQNGDECMVEYYFRGEYLKIVGKVKVMKNIKQIKIADNIINFDDIYEINKIF